MNSLHHTSPPPSTLQEVRDANAELIRAGIREQESAERAKRSATELAALLEREAFLARAGIVLGGSLEYRAASEALAQLVVPKLADACVVHLLLSDVPEPVAVARCEPAGRGADSDSRRIPLIARARTIGTLSLLNSGGRLFTASDLGMVDALAARASVAIDNAMLYA